MTHKFVADAHLGKLAKSLRLLGFDVAHKNDYSNAQLLQLSEQESRILLSRNSAFAKHTVVDSFLVTSEYPFQQLQQVVNHFNLKEQFQPFSRCIVCNGRLEPVAKQNISMLLGTNTAQYFNEFWQCNQCRRIYWKGPHYNAMLKTIATIHA